mmetsp:Transcript_137082/g.292786  ORF Transcript_137082/g.292786 Transcript_137082/m.292786 type:complete len:646 (+) Transcript_137082:180-2117(+)
MQWSIAGWRPPLLLLAAAALSLSTALPQATEQATLVAPPEAESLSPRALEGTGQRSCLLQHSKTTVARSAAVEPTVVALPIVVQPVVALPAVQSKASEQEHAAAVQPLPSAGAGHSSMQAHHAATVGTPAVASATDSGLSDAVKAVGTFIPMVEHSRSPTNETSQKVEHHSIFQLRFQVVNRTTFWSIFCLMIIFTIVIDWLQTLAATHARNSKTEQLFISRINAELMMFGCVGLLMFVLENGLSHVPESQSILIEFVDILCSLGACNLIAIAAMLFHTGKRWKKHWQNFECPRDEDKELDGSGQKSFGVGTLRRFGPREYKVMAQNFCKRQKINSFPYSDYLTECLARNACELMNINWRMWAVLLVVTCLLLLHNMYRESGARVEYSTAFYLTFFAVLNWISFCVYAGILFWTYYAHRVLIKHLDKISEASEEPEQETRELAEDQQEKDKEEKASWTGWAIRVKFCMQGVSLTNSFLISIYVMIVHYNLAREGYSWLWSIFILIPLILSLVVLLPVMITNYTIVKAFFVPDSESIDSVIQTLNQLDHDLQYLRRQWADQGLAEAALHADANPTSTGEMSKEGLAEVLANLGLHVSRARLDRLFMEFDFNKDGAVDFSEIIRKLENTADYPETSRSTGFSVRGSS